MTVKTKPWFRKIAVGGGYKKFTMIFLAMRTVCLMMILPGAGPALNAAVDHDRADLRLYVLGNSLTDQLIYDSFVKMVVSGGKTIALARLTVPGAPIGWLWGNNLDKGGFGTRYGNPRKAFEKWKWDAMTLQPFQWGHDKNIVHAPKFMELLRQHSPDAQTYIYAQWPNASKGGDWSKRWLEPRKTNIMSRQEYEDTVTTLRATVKEGKPVLLIPVGHVMYLLEQKAALGLVPGLKTMWDIYNDGVHLNEIGSFIVGTTYYAALFKISPVGLDHSSYALSKKAGGMIRLTPELARIIQETAWEVVSSHPMTGVIAKEKVAIATPGLMRATKDNPYYFELTPAFGHAPYSWTVAGGKLPDGVTLDTKKGILTGSPSALGNSNVRIAVSDTRKDSAERSFTMIVDPDSVPKITTETLPVMDQGRYVRLLLTNEGGNPPVFWSLEKKGSLPKGLRLEEGGLLHGAPVQSGEFPVIIRVTDGDDKDPDITTRSFTLRVKPAAADIRFAAYFVTLPEIDGRIGEGEPWRFERAEKVLVGKGALRVELAYGWDDNALYVAARVFDTAPGAADRLILYIDGKNNNEAIYNMHHLRIAADLNGKIEKLGGGGGQKHMAAAFAGGYAVEASIPWKALGHRLGRDENPEMISVGLDAAHRKTPNANAAPTAHVVWFGSLKNDEDPTGWRPVIMQAK